MNYNSEIDQGCNSQLNFMKLYYFKDPSLNFGDDLNPWLWNKVLPNFFDNNESTIFIGIGTLLNHRIPKNCMKIVFGAGYGYGDPPIIDSNWKFVCVRGPLTTKILQIDQSYAVTDPAILIHEYFPFKEIPKTSKIAFMPHCQSADLANWNEVCNLVGIRYIDPRQPVENVMTLLSGAELLLAEAMHGAIAADAFRIPWIPVVCYDHISSFKWEDWCQSMNMSYKPERVISIYKGESGFLRIRFKNSIKRALLKVGVWNDDWTRPPQPASKHIDIEKAAKDLLFIAENSKPLLSNDSIFYNRLARLNKLLCGFRNTGLSIV